MLGRILRFSLSSSAESVGLGLEISGMSVTVVSVSSHPHSQTHGLCWLDRGDKGRVRLIPTQGGRE